MQKSYQKSQFPHFLRKWSESIRTTLLPIFLGPKQAFFLSTFLFIEGTEDSDIASYDQFVQRAEKAGAPITYLRVDGMDHWLRKRPDVIDQSFEWLKECLQARLRFSHDHRGNNEEMK